MNAGFAVFSCLATMQKILAKSIHLILHHILKPTTLYHYIYFYANHQVKGGWPQAVAVI